MLYILIILFNAIIIFLLYRILDTLNKNEKQNGNNVVNKRKHATVKTSNYSNSYTNRGYDIYKNENGLYEPQRPSRGIVLKQKEE